MATRTVLEGQPGAPGVGLGWVLPLDGGSNGAEAADRRSQRRPDHRGRAPAHAPWQRPADDLAGLAAATTARAGEEVGAIFEAQALFARDPGIVDPAFTRIAAGQDAATAILEVTDEQAEQLAAVDDPYFRERAADVRDVGRRIAALVRGETRPDLWHADGRPAILVGADLDPSAVAGLRPELTAGIALAGGAPTGHAAIVARALGIPLVLGLGSAIDGLRDGLEAVVDGGIGRLIVGPEAADRAAAGRAVIAATPDDLDLHGIRVVANVASAAEAEAAAVAGAEGIGLVRTELPLPGPPSTAVAWPNSERRTPGSWPRWASARSSSAPSTSAGTSRPRGSPASPRPTPPSASAASDWASASPGCSMTSCRRSWPRSATASCG